MVENRIRWEAAEEMMEDTDAFLAELKASSPGVQSLVVDVFKVDRFWDAPPPSNCHYQDDCIFSSRALCYKPLFAKVAGVSQDRFVSEITVSI